MERVSGITFQPIRNIRFAVSHSERTDLADPGYLLPEEYRLGNRVVKGSRSESEIAARFIKRLENLSPQAKAKGASPFWEGVAVLPTIDDFSTYADRIEECLIKLKVDLETTYGIQVGHISIHLDEGTVIDGKPHYNPHAHIILDRTLIRDFPREIAKTGKVKQQAKKKGSLWTPNASQLAEVQTLVAKNLNMKRGLTKEERNGKPSRRNIDHRIWREMHDGKTPDLAKKLETFKAATDAEIDTLHEDLARAGISIAMAEKKRIYDSLRAFLKGYGKANQADYSALKKAQTNPELIDALRKIMNEDQPDINRVLLLLRGGDNQLVDELYSHPPATLRGDGKGHELSEHKSVIPLLHWQTGEKDLYLLPLRNSNGKRLAFEDAGDTLSIKIATDDGVVRAALLIGKEKWPHQPLKVEGNDEFLRRVERLAAKENIIIQLPDDYVRTHRSSQDVRLDLGR